MADDRPNLTASSPNSRHPADIMHAAEKVRDAGFRKWDVFTPFPVHGMDKAMGLKNSKVGWFSFLGGVTGYTTRHADDLVDERRVIIRIVVGGKPMFSPFSAFPPSYELTILFGVVRLAARDAVPEPPAAAASSAAEEPPLRPGDARPVFPRDRNERPEIFGN